MAARMSKRMKELQEIARQLHYSGLSPSATEDVISICDTVSRGFDGHAGEELTVEEGAFVDSFLEIIIEKEFREKHEIKAMTVVFCTSAARAKIAKAKTFNADDEGREAAKSYFYEWVKETFTKSRESLSDGAIEALWNKGVYFYDGDGYIAVIRST